jgi:hypothetical protein
VKATKKKLTQPADLNTPEGVEWFRQVCERRSKWAKKNPEAARAELLSTGIWTKTGKLSKNYR